MPSDSGQRGESITEGEFIDADHSSYVEFGRPTRRMRPRPLTVVVSLSAIAALVVVAVTLGLHISNKNDVQKTQGKVAMNQKELRSIVLAKHLIVYWSGPLDGYKYALSVDKTGSSFVRYLPDGRGLNDKTSSFRVIATYSLKGAFVATQSAGTKIGNVGFTNVDGDAVFYVKTRPTNVYMGIRNKDIQVEIYDPSVDQSLGLSLIHNLIRPLA